MKWWGLKGLEGRKSIEEVLCSDEQPAMSDFGSYSDSWTDMYEVVELNGRPVFVNWDPLHEHPVCVHTTEDGICERCKVLLDEKRDCYHIEGVWFDIQE